MEDFKKDSLLENYNRITRAKNNRLDEAGMFLGNGFEKPKVHETIDSAYDRIMNMAEQIGHEKMLEELVRSLDDQVAMTAIEYIERQYDMGGDGKNDSGGYGVDPYDTPYTGKGL